MVRVYVSICAAFVRLSAMLLENIQKHPSETMRKVRILSSDREEQELASHKPLL